MANAKHEFTVKPTNMEAFSLIEWDYDRHGLPKRSIQVESEIARLWAKAYLLPEVEETLKQAIRLFGGHSGTPDDPITGIELEQHHYMLERFSALLLKLREEVKP